MTDAALTLRPAYAIREDRYPDVIWMTVEGFFDMPLLMRHFDENHIVVKRWRESGRRIRVLIDAVDLRPHSPEGQACVQAATASIYAPGDRVAVCVASSLVKMQMRRALSQGDVINFFTSEDEALDWLGTY